MTYLMDHQIGSDLSSMINLTGKYEKQDKRFDRDAGKFIFQSFQDGHCNRTNEEIKGRAKIREFMRQSS